MFPVSRVITFILLAIFPSISCMAVDVISNSWITDTDFSGFPKTVAIFRVDTVDRAGIFPLSSMFSVKCPVKSTLAEARDPSQLIFAADASKSMTGKWESVIGAAPAFMKNIGERDRAIVYSFAEWPGYTSAVTRKDQDIASELKTLAVGGGTHLYDCLAHAARRIGPGGLRKRFLLLLSDGRDQANIYSASQASRLKLEQAAEELSEAGITIISIPVSAESNESVMEKLAQLTGGGMHRLSEDRDLKKTFASIKEMTGFSNLLTFEDPFVSPGPRTAEVTLTYRGEQHTWFIPFHSGSIETMLSGHQAVIGGALWNPELVSGSGDSRRLYIRSEDEKTGICVMARENDFAIKLEAPVNPAITRVPERMRSALVIDTSASMTETFDHALGIFTEFFSILTSEVETECYQFAARLLPVQKYGQNLITDGLKASGPTAFYDCLMDAAVRVSREDARSGMVVVSDGWDQSAINSLRQFSRNNLADLIRLCKGLDMPVFTICTGPRPRKSVLTALSRITGGQFFDFSDRDFREKGGTTGAVEAFETLMTLRRPCLARAEFPWPVSDRRSLFLTIVSDSPSGRTVCTGWLEPPK